MSIKDSQFYKLIYNECDESLISLRLLLFFLPMETRFLQMSIYKNRCISFWLSANAAFLISTEREND